MMNNREKIKVEYYTVDGKTHNFEASLIKTSTKESKDNQVMLEIFNHAIKTFNWQPINERKDI